MLALAKTERTRLCLITHAGIKTLNNNEVELVYNTIHSYLNEKVHDLPKNIFSIDSFEHETGLLSSEKISVDSIEIWSCRLLEPDTTVPGRTWSLELTVSKTPDQKTFYSRLSCFSRNRDFDFTPGVPRVYKALVSQNILYGDGTRLSPDPIDVTGEEDIEWLLTLLNSPKRQRGIIAASCQDDGSCLIDPIIFSRHLCGVAHVVRIFPSASFILSDRIGKYHSVFDFGLRIYKPTSNLEEDDPVIHKLYTRNFLSRVDLSNVQNQIFSDAFRISFEENLKTQTVLTFAQIRSAGASLKLSALKRKTDSTDLELFKQQALVSTQARLAADSQAQEALEFAVQEVACTRFG